MSSVLFLASCSASQKAALSTQQADLNFQQKNYEQAYQLYTQLMDSYTAKKQTVPPQLLASAGKCLFYMNDTIKAVDMLSRADAQGFSDSQSLCMRIKYFAAVDNLSKELDLLDRYSSAYPEGEDIKFVNERKFVRYVEMGEYAKACEAYAGMDDASRNQIPVLEKYHQACRKMDNDAEADIAAQKLYKLDPSNAIGLNAVAYNAYITTENEYVAAIKAYEAKKTNEAYAKLQRTVAPLTARYKKARDLYLKLYNITKKPYDAAILSRIYSRLNDKKNSDYYARLAKQ